MTQNRLTFWAIVAGAVLVLLSQTLYVVDQTEQALIIRFGQVVGVVNPPGGKTGPGLKVKMPFVDSIVRFDKRNQALDTTDMTTVAADQEQLVVDAYLRYRIANPFLFYTAMGGAEQATDRLRLRLDAALREELGRATADDIVSKRRPQLMAALRDNLARQARGSELGIQIIDVRIKRADLLPANQASVFERMKTARQQQAVRIRAEGQQRAKEIVATATGDAERIRGEGDAERARLFADSFGRDPGFASFYRSMRAYEVSMANGETTLILSPDSDFFKYFSRGPGQ